MSKGGGGKKDTDNFQNPSSTFTPTNAAKYHFGILDLQRERISLMLCKTIALSFCPTHPHSPHPFHLPE